jgi:bifunctional pyridoxal-dependent enzyme with beta-cystathionase and maltose regulon repressor activities
MLDDLAWESPPSRRSAKGSRYHDDVLPMWIAEMDLHVPTAQQQQPGDDNGMGASTREGECRSGS